LTVEAGESAKVTVKITLGDKDKKYLDASFLNGMYVEGYITLTAESGTDVDLNVPYLAFYGDWNKAPIFDMEYYETNADELNDAIAVEDKIMADAKKVKSMDEALALANVKSDTLRRVTFSSAAYVSKVPASENVISGVAS
jgi:hypothetical protein